MKYLNYRVSQIPSDSRTKEAFMHCFHSDDKQHVYPKSLFPAETFGPDDDATYIATIEYRGEGEPRLDPSKVALGLTIDKHFEGFTPLFVPDGIASADIIAITGLGGHALGSWMSKRGDLWLRDHLPKDIERKARILVYGYPSAVCGSHSNSNIRDYADRFWQDLMDMRADPMTQDRPLIFIGHSLGGIIVKHALSHLEKEVRQRLPVRAILFFGTPHAGLNIDALKTVVKGRPNENLIRDLDQSSQTLADLASKFRFIAENLKIYSFYEAKETALVEVVDGVLCRGSKKEIMVQRTSAVLNIPTEEQRSVPADHRDLVRLEKSPTGDYRYVSRILREAMQTAEQKYEGNKKQRQAGFQDPDFPAQYTAFNPDGSEGFSPDPYRDIRTMRMGHSSPSVNRNSGAGSEEPETVPKANEDYFPVTPPQTYDRPERRMTAPMNNSAVYPQRPKGGAVLRAATSQYQLSARPYGDQRPNLRHAASYMSIAAQQEDDSSWSGTASYRDFSPNGSDNAPGESYSTSISSAASPSSAEMATKRGADEVAAAMASDQTKVESSNFPARGKPSQPEPQKEDGGDKKLPRYGGADSQTCSIPNCRCGETAAEPELEPRSEEEEVEEEEDDGTVVKSPGYCGIDGCTCGKLPACGRPYCKCGKTNVTPKRRQAIRARCLEFSHTPLVILARTKKPTDVDEDVRHVLQFLGIKSQLINTTPPDDTFHAFRCVDEGRNHRFILLIDTSVDNKLMLEVNSDRKQDAEDLLDSIEQHLMPLVSEASMAKIFRRVDVGGADMIRESESLLDDLNIKHGRREGTSTRSLHRCTTKEKHLFRANDKCGFNVMHTLLPRSDDMVEISFHWTHGDKALFSAAALSFFDYVETM